MSEEEEKEYQHAIEQQKKEILRLLDHVRILARGCACYINNLKENNV